MTITDLSKSDKENLSCLLIVLIRTNTHLLQDTHTQTGSKTTVLSYC